MTSEENAEKIWRHKLFISREYDHSIYFSDRVNGYASDYGAHCVVVDIPETLLRLDDEFPTGERHYAVHAGTIRHHYFMGHGPVPPPEPPNTGKPRSGRDLAQAAGWPARPSPYQSKGTWWAVCSDTYPPTKHPCGSDAAARSYVAAHFSGVVTFRPYWPASTPYGLVREAAVLHNGQPTNWTIRKAVAQR